MDRKEEILSKFKKRFYREFSDSDGTAIDIDDCYEAMETYKRECVIEELESLGKKLRLAGDRNIVNSRISELKK